MLARYVGIQGLLPPDKEVPATIFEMLRIVSSGLLLASQASRHGELTSEMIEIQEHLTALDRIAADSLQTGEYKAMFESVVQEDKAELQRTVSGSGPEMDVLQLHQMIVVTQK